MEIEDLFSYLSILRPVPCYLRLSGVLGRYITTRLDDAEVILTRAESSIDRDDGDYLDLEAAKKALDTFEVSERIPPLFPLVFRE